MQSYEIKPNKTAFVTYRFLRGFLFLFVIILFFSVILSQFVGFQVFYIIPLFILIILLRLYSLSVRYRKEKYVFYSDKIIRKSGGIFSDNETELVIRNITHIKMQLPFIEHKLFQTGSISIESAGSGSAEVFLLSIDKPAQIYKYVQRIMKSGGFALTMTKLLQKEKPSMFGVFFEVFKGFFGTIFTIIFVGVYIGASLGTLMLSYPIISISIVFAIFVLLFFRSILKFLDLKQRIYNVYSDTITYSEGFLSKHYSLIPVENLSDSTITQTLIDKLFGLYDVKLSCQGSGSEILFKNMINGPNLKANIDNLINKTQSLVGRSTLEKVKKSVQPAKPSYVARDTQFTAQYQMDTIRTVLPLIIIGVILFPLMFIWVPIIIGVLIQVFCTKYFVKQNSMEEQFDFINSKHKEFTNDKIMGIVFKESFVDRWFGTCSINFWSIGSSENIKFRNIKKTSGLYESILAKSGISPEEVLYQMDSKFGFIDMLKSTFFLTLIVCCAILFLFFGSFLLSIYLIVPLIVIIVLYGIIIIYRKVYYGRSKMVFYKNYAYFKRGIFFKEQYYSLYNNIKGITTVKYPFTGKGYAKFNIAGEHIVGQGKNQRIVSNNFKINYIENIDNKDELIDIILYKRPGVAEVAQIEQNISSYQSKQLLISKPDLANSVFGYLLFSVILFPFLALVPIVLPIIIWSVKVKSYIIEDYRALAKSGILYKKQISIVFSKIDHINFDQGMLNKMFKNGNITVNTTGSSRAEMTIFNIPNFKEFFEELKQNY